MKHSVMVLALASGIAAPGAWQPAAAQAPLHNPKVSIEYKEPNYEQIYQRVRARKVLEELDQLLSPLNLNHELKLVIDEGDSTNCRDPNSYYDPSAFTVHLCYSWFYMLENQASVKRYTKPEDFTLQTLGLMPGFTRQEVIVGGSIGNALHEIGHALFHIQNIPILGKEEDAADQIAGFMMLQFGTAVALPTIKGMINVWHHFQAEDWQAGTTISTGAQADVHGLSIQRAHNYLCLAYGKDPATFKELADRYLPDDRMPSCAAEYQAVKRAFDKTILPRVDQAKMKQVMAMPILNVNDLK